MRLSDLVIYSIAAIRVIALLLTLSENLALSRMRSPLKCLSDHVRRFPESPSNTSSARRKQADVGCLRLLAVSDGSRPGRGQTV